MAKVLLGELLVTAGLVTEAQVLAAVRGQRATGLPLGHYLIRTGVLSEDELLRVLSQQLSVPVIALDVVQINHDATAKVPAEFAVANLIVPYRLDGRLLAVATSDPTREDVLDQIRLSSMCDARFALATPSMIDRGLARAYGDRAAAAVANTLAHTRTTLTSPAFDSSLVSPASLDARMTKLESTVSKIAAVLVDSELVAVDAFK